MFLGEENWYRGGVGDGGGVGWIRWAGDELTVFGWDVIGLRFGWGWGLAGPIFKGLSFSGVSFELEFTFGIFKGNIAIEVHILFLGFIIGKNFIGGFIGWSRLAGFSVALMNFLAVDWGVEKRVPLKGVIVFDLGWLVGDHVI